MLSSFSYFLKISQSFLSSGAFPEIGRKIKEYIWNNGIKGTEMH